MNKTTSCRHGLQLQSDENPAKIGYSKVPYSFLAVPKLPLRGLKKHLISVFLAIVDSIRSGVSDPPIRWIAAYAGLGERQTQRNLGELSAMGVINRIFRRIGRFCNLTTIYEIPSMLGRGVMHDTEKLIDTLTTTTSTLARGVFDRLVRPKSWKQVAIERSVAINQADHDMRRSEYEGKGKFWAKSNDWKLNKARERNNRAMAACQGMYTGPESTPEEREAYLRYFREKGMLGGMMEAI